MPHRDAILAINKLSLKLKMTHKDTNLAIKQATTQALNAKQ